MKPRRTTPVTQVPRRVAALLFGLNYEGTDAELRGCVRDVQNVAAFLATQLRFPLEAVAAFTTAATTTRAAILEQLQTLARRSADLDFVWLHYSGHGTWQRDASGDEPDGRDECWVPSDYATAGVIPDDVIGATLRTFAPTTRVFFVSDSCHSGTVADLPYAWRVDARGRTPMRTPASNASAALACTPPAPRIVALSGCLDTQTAADAFGIDPAAPGTYSGALTTTLLRVLTETPLARRDVFYAATRVAAALRARRFSQVPLLSASFALGLTSEFLT